MKKSTMLLGRGLPWQGSPPLVWRAQKIIQAPLSARQPM